MKDELSKISIEDLEGLFTKLGWDKEEFYSAYAKNLILNNWTEIVGEGYSNYTYPFEIKNNKLIILIAHDVYRMELEFKKNLIFQKIETLLNKKLITQLGFKLGTIPENFKKKNLPPEPKKPNHNSHLYYLIPETEDEVTKQKLRELIDSFPST